jgi:hypothetical protein
MKIKRNYQVMKNILVYHQFVHRNQAMKLFIIILQKMTNQQHHKYQRGNTTMKKILFLILQGKKMSKQHNIMSKRLISYY